MGACFAFWGWVVAAHKLPIFTFLERYMEMCVYVNVDVYAFQSMYIYIYLMLRDISLILSHIVEVSPNTG